ncbi:hypothetical protein LQF12_03605 [Ruania suaedae]|uniref:hypothetical protein n=1 Tax=Ruania suaedae TaxID=2897774 RepID=UPI001E320138|nr:hypothetical protein [Ruania suaedae]UFU03705.1 hypothetical protein LQF12_03605 [Ruania suaedae]
MTTLPRPADVAHAGDPFSFRALVVELVALLATTVRLLRTHGFTVLVLALVGVTVRLYLQDLSVLAGRLGAVPGMLTLTLVPFATLLTTVAILLVLRRRARSRSVVRDLIAALGSVLVPFLVVYESGGGLREDGRTYSLAGLEDDFARMDIGDVDGTARLADATSPIVLAIVVVALVLRRIGSQLVERDSLWHDQEAPVRMSLRIVVGYFELVWIVLGAGVIGYLVNGVNGWWHSRVIARAVGAWWDGVTLVLPSLGGVVSWLIGAGGAVLAGAVTAIVVPLAWLTIGLVIYGVRTSELVSAADLSARVPFSGRFTDRAQDPRVARAWERMSQPEGRFGMLMAGLGLMVRSGWAPLAAYSLLYLLLTFVPYAVWGLFRAIVPWMDGLAWNAWWEPLTIASDIATMVLTATLLAATADRLLARLGAPTALRLPARPVR